MFAFDLVLTGRLKHSRRQVRRQFLPKLPEQINKHEIQFVRIPEFVYMEMQRG